MFQIITFAFIVSHYSKKVNKKILTAFGTTGDTKNFGKTQFTILGQTADDLKELKKSMESLGYGKLDFTNLGTFGKTSSGNITAFFKAIMQGSSDTAAQLKVDTESIQKYIDEYSLNGLDAAKKKYDEFMSDASSQAKLYVQQTDAAALSTDAFAESQTRLAKISNSVVGGLKDIGAAIASAGLTLIASAAINFVVKTIYEEVTAMERMRDAGTEASKAVDSNAQSISDYISQISTLKESLDSGTLSENEAYDARKQLLSIQDSIIDKYGEEAAGVDLLNGSLQTQIDKLNEIANSDMRDWLSDNSKAIVDAQNKMSANNEYMSQYLGTLDESDLSEVNKLVSKYSSKGLSLENTSDGLVLKVTADMTDAKEVLADLNDDIKNSGALSENTAAILEHSIKLASQDVESGLNTYQSYVDKASEYQIQTNDHYRKLYEDLKDASEKYSEAVAKDDAKAIEDALKVSRSAIEAFNNDAFDQATLTSSDNQFIKQFMQAQADELESSTKLKAAQIGLQEVLKTGNTLYKESQKAVAGLTEAEKQYGNVSNVNRDAIKWNAENMHQYRSAIRTNGWNDIGVGDWSTAEGVSNTFGEGKNAIEIAYTPMLQTDEGLVPLSSGGINRYMNTLVEKATDKNGKIDVDKLMKLDTDGMDIHVNGQLRRVQNMIAAAEGQIVDGVKLTGADVAAIAGENTDELMERFGHTSDYVGKSMHDIQDQTLKYKTVAKDAFDDIDYSTLTDYLDITEEDAKDIVDTIKSSVQSLNGLNDLDLADIGSLENAGTEITAYTKEQVQAYDNMKSAADKLGISMSDLIDILVKAGLVTGESIKYTNEFTTNALSAATNATKAISLVTAAMQSQSTTAGVSSDSYSELIKEQGEYAAALDFENGYVKLNTDMAKKITQAKIDEAEANIKLAYSQNQMKYSQVKADLEALNTAVQQNGELEGENAEQVEKARSELEAQSKQLRENCRNLQMQYSLLVQNSGAYQDWVNAQNASEAGDMYDSIIKAKQAIAEGLKNGKIGTEKFKAAVELTIPEDYQGDIAKYVKRLNRYFKQASDGSADASGLNNFLKDSIKAGLMSKDAKDQITIAANKTTKDFADALHLSMEDVQSIWGELQEYGWEFDWGSLLGNPVDNLRMQIDDIQDQMDALGDDAENSPVWQALNEQLTDLQEKLKETFSNADASQINQSIEDIVYEATKANGVLTESQTEALYAMGRVQNMYDLKEAQDKLTEAQKNYNEAVQSGKNYSDLQGLTTELQNAQDKVTQLTQQKEKLGEPTPLEINSFAVKYAAGEIDGLQHDAEETTQMLSNIGCTVDTTQAQSEIDVQNQKAEQFTKTLSNVPVTLDTSTCQTKIANVSKALDGLKREVPITLNFGVKGTIISAVSNGLSVFGKRNGSKSSDTHNSAAGTPNASGGKTLVGEIGNELVVNPHTGKWYTVGDNGAEFVNLPHGAIVFDHEKTQRLLKNGFVGGYGDALVSGNAMDAGSPGVGSFVGTAGNNYLPGKNPLVKSTYKATTASTKATKDNSKALEENKKALEKQKTALEKQKTALEKESNKLKIYGQAALNEIEKREKALNKEKEAQDKVYESQIKELEKRKTALQKANDEEDRAIKLAELQDALEKAKANRTVRIYNKNEGFVWRADQQAVSDAQNDLDDQKRQWKNDDILQAVDDEIERINNLKDAYDESVEAQIADLDDMKEKWNEVISLIGTSWEDYQLGLEAAAHFNDMTLDGMAGDLVGYKDDVLANMKEIGGVTDQIDSITESIEKLEEAISNAKDAASSGGGSGGSDSSASFGADTGADVEADSDLSQDTQDLLDKLEELREVYSGLGKDTDDLSEKQRGLVDTITNLTEGTKAHFNAVDELGTVQQTTADKQALMRDVLSEYMTTLSQCTDLTAEQRAELTQAMDDIVNSYSGGYDTIDKLIQGYNDTLIESGDMTNESYQQQLENLLEFADQNQASYDTIAEILNSNFEAVAENTDLTYGQRQSQIASLVDLANQYGVSSDDIINHLANIATQEEYAAESTDITHAAMMTTVQMTCVEMGASYDSLRAKIESVTQAQQKMLEAIGKADFNTLMPMGTATSHGNKIQWGKPNFDPLQHATGVLNAATTHIAITDEKGPEIKMRKPSAGNYSLIEKGTTVIPADASASIWKFGLDPESFIASHMPQRSIKSVEITQPNTGNGVTVSVGDIQMYGVNDVESFGRVIHERVGTIFAQEFSRR